MMCYSGTALFMLNATFLRPTECDNQRKIVCLGDKKCPEDETKSNAPISVKMICNINSKDDTNERNVEPCSPALGEEHTVCKEKVYCTTGGGGADFLCPIGMSTRSCTMNVERLCLPVSFDGNLQEVQGQPAIIPVPCPPPRSVCQKPATDDICPPNVTIKVLGPRQKVT